MGRPTSTATVTLRTRGPVVAPRISRSAVSARVSTSASTATEPLYSLCTITPWATPSGRSRPLSPSSRTASRQAFARSSSTRFRRNSMGSSPSFAAELVDHELLRGPEVLVVEVADAAGGEPVEVEDLVVTEHDRAEVVGHAGGQQEDRLRERELVGEGQLRGLRRDHVAERLGVVGGDAGLPLLEADDLAEARAVGCLHPRDAHRVDASPARHCFGAVPHEPHGLPDLLRHARRVERGVAEEPAAEGTAAAGDVDVTWAGVMPRTWASWLWVTIGIGWASRPPPRRRGRRR